MHAPSDFRSDTVTQPSPAMREAMATALVGDDVLDGDPTVRRLEESAAAWLGKERALYVPSGTMANQVALGAWTRAGDEILVQRFSHVTTFEAGAPGYLHGLQSMTVGGVEGDMDADEVRASLRPDFIHCPKTALVCMEQTHNYAGGRVLPMEQIAAVTGVARERDIPTHLDGARLANAVVASGTPATAWTAHFDSVSLCFSKGLGAPVGSVVAGPADFIERGMLVRKRLGGWMRQAGHLAAAAQLALDTGVERLGQDHALAKDLAARLAAVDGLQADPDTVDTNIAMVHVTRAGLDAATVATALGEHGIQVFPMGEFRLRFVTHLGLGPADVDRLVAAANLVLGA